MPWNIVKTIATALIQRLETYRSSDLSKILFGNYCDNKNILDLLNFLT